MKRKRCEDALNSISVDAGGSERAWEIHRKKGRWMLRCQSIRSVGLPLLAGD